MKTNYLQNALLANATFSGLSGILLIFFHRYFADTFGMTASISFWIIGLMLVFFASTIVSEIFKQRRLFVKMIIIQDALFVVGSVFLLIFNPFNISSAGNYWIAGVALVVFCMAINQMVALKRTAKL